MIPFFLPCHCLGHHESWGMPRGGRFFLETILQDVQERMLCHVRGPSQAEASFSNAEGGGDEMSKR